MTVPTATAVSNIQQGTPRLYAVEYARQWRDFMVGVQKGLEDRRQGKVQPLSQVIADLEIT